MTMTAASEEETKPLTNNDTNGNGNTETNTITITDTDTDTDSNTIDAAIFKSIAKSNCENKTHENKPFCISASDLSALGNDRSRSAFIALFQQYVQKATSRQSSEDNAAEIQQHVKLIQDLTDALQNDETNQETHPEHMEMAALALTSILLRSSPESGITSSPTEITHRTESFGSNAISEKKLTSFIKLCWEAVQDFVLIMLIIMGVVSILVETTIGRDDNEPCGHCWIEGFAILMSVCIVVLVTAGIDYMKQFAFKRLNKSLEARNTKSVIRDGNQVVVTDKDIVVGDILSVNSHSLASIPADCILLGPAMDLHMNESSLTGESHAVKKIPGDVVLSGTNAIQGSGKMIVISVGIHSVAGKIKAQVYESEERENDMDGDDETPLYQKIDKIAKQIGIAGTVAAVFAFAVSAGIGLGHHKEEWKAVIDYFIVAVTVLAVAVPEGLPLAVVLALAFSSNKMMGENNMVKTLDACETMGCATTICTDKTGTLTANQMTARAVFTSGKNYICTDAKQTLGEFLQSHVNALSEYTISMLTKSISICTMNESSLTMDDDKGTKIVNSSGNPTEVALLVLVHDLGRNYRQIRSFTAGRSDSGDLADRYHEGKLINFSSARKMMSWAVPLDNGGYRLYSKGAAEVILARCTMEMTGDEEVELTEANAEALTGVVEQYARRGMRCIALAYRDLPPDMDFEATSDTIKNSDGTEANLAETEMVFCALVGIEDPLRPEVPEAIQKCYQAGIEVRLVTGDSPNTAVSIAHQAGILSNSHFREGSSEMIASNLKPNVLMEGKDFRSQVYKMSKDGKKEFDQEAFDQIWPYLRVLARSSPDDKLTLAHGLNQSLLFEDEARCKRLLKNDNIKIFPDRQVVAMTGDGTNDAPALKRADIGFAMGIAGTQIAKDAADIILIDDNFASIVTAAKWGRNVYASIQKFLQFQLTVNIAAVLTALVGAVVYQKSPLAAIQLLWVNLLMDSLASLALASEPPTAALLNRPPVNRSKNMLTRQMLANMLGQAFFQVLVTLLLLFQGPQWFDIEPGHLVEKQGRNSEHYTIIFNTFVWMQLFNEINSRNLRGEFNVFQGLHKNPYFISILLITSALQCVMVEVGGRAMHVVDGGLDGKYWALSMGIGVLSLPVQQIINLAYRALQKKYDWTE